MNAVTPPLGDIRLLGEATCGRSVGPTINDGCGKPATWHVLWTADGDNGLTCDEHYAEVGIRWASLDSHPFGGVCCMPNTVWIDSTSEPPGLCRWVVDDETHALNAAEYAGVVAEMRAEVARLRAEGDPS